MASARFANHQFTAGIFYGRIMYFIMNQIRINLLLESVHFIIAIHLTILFIFEKMNKNWHPKIDKKYYSRLKEKDYSPFQNHSVFVRAILT